MSTAALKRELALLRGSLAALTRPQSATLDDAIAWAERIAGLTLDPWQRDVLLSVSPRLLLNATRQSGKSTAAALKAAWTVLVAKGEIPSPPEQEAEEECLHCAIVALVEARIAAGGADAANLSALIVESLVDLILRVPEEEQAQFLAQTLSALGDLFLQKSGLVGEGPGSTH